MLKQAYRPLPPCAELEGEILHAHTHVAAKGLLSKHIHPMDIIVVFLKLPCLPTFAFPLMLGLFLFPGSQNQLMPEQIDKLHN